MSPNVGNFVQDLVHMAQATERLPQVEAELEENRGQLLQQIAHSQKLEENIIGYKREIEDFQSKVRDAEVARDDAELRFLELDEKANKAVRLLDLITDQAKDAALTLAPPTPTPEPEPVTSGGEGVMGQPSNLVATWPAPDAPQGQSESHPTTTTEATASSTDATTQIASPNVQEPAITSANLGQEQPHKPYLDKLYYDHPAYVSLSNWLAGGGSEENYYRSKPRDYTTSSFAG